MSGDREPQYAAVVHHQRGLIPVWVREDMPPRKRVIRDGRKRREVISRMCIVRRKMYGYVAGQVIWVDIRMIEIPTSPHARTEAQKRRDRRRKAKALKAEAVAQGLMDSGTLVTSIRDESKLQALGDSGELGK